MLDRNAAEIEHKKRQPLGTGTVALSVYATVFCKPKKSCFRLFLVPTVKINSQRLLHRLLGTAAPVDALEFRAACPASSWQSIPSFVSLLAPFV